MIEKIYEEIRLKLLALKLNEAKEYFDMNNVPDSLADKGFNINLINFDGGEYTESSTKKFNGKIIQLKSLVKINLSYKLTADNVNQKLKDISIMTENIIKAVLSIDVGIGEKDKIEFVGSVSSLEKGLIITEINFEISFRILNV